MNIQGTIINDSEIIGIGALMLEFSKDLTIQQIYGSRRYQFELFCKNSTITIRSEWFDTTGQKDEVLQRMKQQADEFRDDYNRARSKVALIIGENDDINGKLFDRDLKRLGEYYEHIKSNLHSLSILTEERDSYDLLFDLLREMRDLAAVTMRKLYKPKEVESFS